jgi:F-type H+-transporting ATPase subunit delta
MTSIAGLRYVAPLFELAREKGILEDVERVLKAFSKLINESPDLEELLLNPRISAEKKKEIIIRLTQDDPVPLVEDFFCLLVDKGREPVFLSMDMVFTKLLQEASNIIPATVQSPVALDEDLKNELTGRFEQVTGKTVELTVELKPELIAGIKVFLGSKMLDASLKTRLQGMRRHLVQASRKRTE